MFQVSFLDYLVYIPLFLSMHDKMVDNPLDQRHKYEPRPLSGSQRDMNPLGFPLRTNSTFLAVSQINDVNGRSCVDVIL